MVGVGVVGVEGVGSWSLWGGGGVQGVVEGLGVVGSRDGGGWGSRE